MRRCLQQGRNGNLYASLHKKTPFSVVWKNIRKSHPKFNTFFISSYFFIKLSIIDIMLERHDFILEDFTPFERRFVFKLHKQLED